MEYENSCRVLASTSAGSISIVHQVPEGHLGVYWRGGALLKTLTDPGFHLKLPLISEFQPIQVTLQTDQARNIPCGTKGGVMISFEKIEVVNHLYKDYVFETLQSYGAQYDKIWIYDRIYHMINQFCSCHSLQEVYVDVFDQIEEVLKEALQADCRHYAPGIEILSVHVTKPVIPNIIRRSFELMEERIKMEQKLAEQNSIRKQEDIRNAIYLCKEKSIANADFFSSWSSSSLKQLLTTPNIIWQQGTWHDFRPETSRKLFPIRPKLEQLGSSLAQGIIW
ncbi:Erlin-2 [Heracleum sosnowskyi]|uniref:Erlin-2 n=1 Tax=Heracleum sosnowskyi TaxID=360622 RepID=A0AAD8JEY3_9APIA|nr:Erlin-2 [Heracleum sosnowskyi]